jgi:hypothetical protein
LNFANCVVEIIEKHIIKSLALAVERAVRSSVVAEWIEEQLVVFLEIRGGKDVCQIIEILLNACEQLSDVLILRSDDLRRIGISQSKSWLCIVGILNKEKSTMKLLSFAISFSKLTISAMAPKEYCYSL